MPTATKIISPNRPLRFPSCLRASVPSRLRVSFPSCLRAYVPSCLPRTLIALLFASACIIAAPHAQADDSADTLALLVGVLKDTSDPAAQADILKGLNAAMEGKRNVKMPDGWAELNPKLAQSTSEEVRKQAAKLSAVFGDAGTLEAMNKTALDPAKPHEEREKALAALLAKGDPSVVPLLQKLVGDSALREAAIKGLATFDDPRTPAVLLAAYPDLDVNSRRAAINTLSFRKSFGHQLMEAVQAGKIPQKDLTAYTVRQLRNLDDKEIDAWISKVWGVARTSPDAKLKEIEKYKAILTPEELKKADASHGRLLFSKTCQQCHTLYGEGGKVGPDLTGSNRQDIDYIMTNVVDPSAVIAKEYMVTNIWMKDGDVYSGIVTREDDNSVAVTTESGVQTLQRSDIKDLRKSELSMMPEGLLTTLSKPELIDLVAYLRTTAQVPLPK